MAPDTPATTAGAHGTGDADPLVADLATTIGDRVTAGVPLATVTTLRVGGPARAMVVAESDDDLAAVGASAQDHGVPTMVVGRGSNLLVGRDGWPGIVVQLGRGFRGIEVASGDATTPTDDSRPPGRRVVAGAADPLPVVAVAVADAGLAGFAWATAVPGTLGGAVRMNAGAHGGDMSDALVEVEVYRLRHRAREVWPAAMLHLSYRHSELPDDAVVVGATLSLPEGDADRIRTEMREIRAWRREHQPLNEPNCGSVFTNPSGDSAGRLVEAVGAKGMAVGGARISERHANFIVTRPDATAEDVVELVRRVHALVREQVGIDLVPEVRVAGSLARGRGGSGADGSAGTPGTAGAAWWR